MKKNTIKAFTLVEMLIVIVIIGILIASLMPRMQTAQGRARDVARKNDLSQIQTAIITSQQDRWEWPETATANAGTAVAGTVAEKLQNAWMTQVPEDPNGDNQVTGLWSTAITAWKYGYMVTKRNSIQDWWFILMARTEVAWSSNWVVCPSEGDGACSAADEEGYDANAKDMRTCWRIAGANGVDLKDIVLCTKFEKWSTCSMDKAWQCNYTDEGQLRYVLIY